jgi:hypothetical protein
MQHSSTQSAKRKTEKPESGYTDKRSRAPGGAGAGVQARLLSLQHAAGNRAVSALLSRGEDRREAPDTGHAQEIARRGLETTGQPLDATIRARMEARFGQDFGQVRVHTGEQAEESATAIQAKAYTVGQDIVFGRGRLAQGTGEGRRLLAHELAHVVQQGRGGATAPGLYNNGPLEMAANRAASQAANGNGTVAVAGASAPGVMRDPDDEEESEKASQRKREKEKTQKRKQERAAAGKDPSQISQAEAERELRALEAEYSKPGAKQRSLKTKEQDLKRYKELLKRVGGTQLDKNKRQGAFDELQRTPTVTSGKTQTKHVAGGPQLPGQDLRPGKDKYAQPDYSIVIRRKNGTFERVHVNLKSDQIDMHSPAKARATAKTYVEQAIRNSRHLAEGEKIIISFAHTPSKEVQEEMKREFFRQGSPVGEVRFGTTTHKRENYKPPAQQPTKQTTTQKGKTPANKKVKQDPKKAAAKKKDTQVTKKSTQTVKKPSTTKTQTTKQKVQKPKVATQKLKTPNVKTPNVTTKKAATPDVTAKNVTTPDATTSQKPKVNVMTPKVTPKISATKITTPNVTPTKITTPKVSAPKVTKSTPPRIPVRGGLRGGGGLSGGDRAAAGAAIVEAIAVPIINHYMRKHFAEKVETEARELISKAIEEKRLEYDKLIEANRADIQRVQAEGREVSLRVAVDTTWQDTDIGTVLMNAKVGDYQLVYEDGPQPKPYERSKPGGWAGDLLRGHTGTEMTFQTFDIALEGTDPEARAKRQSRKKIDAMMRGPMGKDMVQFEQLIIAAMENNLPLDPLADYAVYRAEQAGRAFEAGMPAKEAGLAYWAEQVALLDGTLDQLIAAAKAKNIPLTKLRAVAVERRDLAGQSSDAGAGPAAAAYWSEVIRAIDQN